MTVIPLSSKKRRESREVMKKKYDDGEEEETRTRMCLGCGIRKTFDRFARTKCDRCSSPHL